MRKFMLLAVSLIFVSQIAEAGILSNLFNNRYYNNGYYNNGYYNNYNRPVYNYNRRYYNNYPQYYNNGYYPQNMYYNQQPVIYRTRVRRSMNDKKEIVVANHFAGIDNLERQMFNQTFEYDSAKNRIERLEHKLFGACQSGTLEERVQVLKSAAKNYKAFNGYVPQSAYSNQYRPPIFTGTMGSNWRNTLWGNFKNQFAGMPTGFTPAMDPAYMDYFEAERAMMGSGQNSYVRTRRGYDYSNINRGTQTGVTILD